MEKLKYIIEDSTIAEVLGVQNFTNEESAILELVKNAYDAQSLDVVIIISKSQIIIEDNGIGIPAADLPRVFDKGFTGENGRRYSKSTGIGLYLSQKLCKKMNIVLSVSSDPGQGTTVTMVFPTESYLKEAGL